MNEVINPNVMAFCICAALYGEQFTRKRLMEGLFGRG